MRDEERFVREVRAAESRVRVGGIYRHYKKGSLYRVLAVGFIEATEEIAVVYKAEYGEGLVWVRSLANFTEEVGGSKRFEPVEEEK